MSETREWSPIESRGNAQVSTFLASATPDQVLVVMLRTDQDSPMPLLVGEYALDLSQRLADGWTLLTMTMYPVGHRTGAGFPGMDLDKAMVVATYRRDAAGQP